MYVHILDNLQEPTTLELECTNLSNILNGIRLHLGEESYTNILQKNYKYILVKDSDPENPVILLPEVCYIDLKEFDRVFIAPEIQGDYGFEYVVTALAYIGVSAATVGTATAAILAAVITVALNMAVSIALGAIMQAISPTNELGKDPAQAQSSRKRPALFNGPVIIRDQGGSVPLVFGNPYCGGVLVSSNIYVGKD